MLRITKQPSGDFLIDDQQTGESILLPRAIAGKIKKESTTEGEFVKKLYEELGNNPKDKEILDRNLKPTEGVSSPTEMPERAKAVRDNVKQLFNDLMRMSIKEVCYQTKEILKPIADESGKGLLLFITAERGESIRNLAIALSKELSDDKPLPIYLTYGHIRGNDAWPFARVKNNRVRLMSDGYTKEEISLMFPQDRPVIVLVENFDCLDPHDQLAYAHMIDSGQEMLRLYPGSIVIAGMLSTNQGMLAPGVNDRGPCYELSE